MRVGLFRIFPALLLASTLGCGGTSNNQTPVTPTIGTLATVQGMVMLAGTYYPLDGVTVSIGGATVTTGLDGMFAISDLKGGAAVLTAQRQGFARFSEAVMLEGARTFNVFLAASNVPRYGGQWSGTWQSGAKSGGLVSAIFVDTVAETVRVGLDIGGNIVDDFDPPGESYVGNLSGETVHFAQKSPIFGNVTVDVGSGGQIVGRVTQVPIGGVQRFDFSGTITASTVIVDYIITFNDNTLQTGSARLIKN